MARRVHAYGLRDDGKTVCGRRASKRTDEDISGYDPVPAWDDDIAAGFAKRWGHFATTGARERFVKARRCFMCHNCLTGAQISNTFEDEGWY